jgi:hypothetical protein
MTASWQTGTRIERMLSGKSSAIHRKPSRGKALDVAETHFCVVCGMRGSRIAGRACGFSYASYCKVRGQSVYFIAKPGLKTHPKDDVPKMLRLKDQTSMVTTL